ncbi:MAG: flavodoxin-dependent (E)-4-hydroxy-3-methylbut-2-enyl-diphosphate synthase [Acidobacteriota bacterium]
MNPVRKKTKKVMVGNLFIGGCAPITVQSMTKTDTRNIPATIKQIRRLEDAGCEIIRCAVPDGEAAEALREIKKKISIPLVADIHFDYRLALIAMEGGVDKLRINPGNIGERGRVEKVVRMAKERDIPIRIGVNSGSLEKDILKKYGEVNAEAMVESAMRHIAILESLDFGSIVISLKASDIQRTVASYRLLSEKVEYPLHIGITESGSSFRGAIKSSIGLGILLSEGIGDTLRVSITGNPEKEVEIGLEILRSMGIRQDGAFIVSCPVCGRCEIDMTGVAAEIEKSLSRIRKPVRIAIMGCAVNGPGEAMEADLGIAGGKEEALIFRKGTIIRKVKERDIVEEFLREVEDFLKDR